MTRLIHVWFGAVAALFVVFLGGCAFSNDCGDLVYHEVSNSCRCPENSVPDYELQACVRPNGTVIPWQDHPVAYVDGGVMDAPDALDGFVDSSIPLDMGDQQDGNELGDVGGDSSDVGPAPEPTHAVFPWNGYQTGCPHVPSAAAVVDHPLRPKFMWTPSPAAHQYQIQLSRECAIGSFRECEFMDTVVDELVAGTNFRPAASLPVATRIPVGSRYFWRVRACSESGRCSAWTTVRYLDVGRVGHDLNGDGYPDVAVGAPGHREGLGETFVYFGGPLGIPTAPDYVNEQGAQVAMIGDINADGFDDLLVTTTAADGSGHILFGRPGEPAAVADILIENPLASSNTFFGFASTPAGDLNGDGYADFAISAPHGASPTTAGGVVYVFFGGTGGLSAIPPIRLNNPEDRPSGNFGVGLGAAGDTNGDGLADLVIGAPSNGADEQGRAYLFLGQQGARPMMSVSIMHGLAARAGQFGFSTEGAGDLNGDGLSDVVVGAPNESFPEPAEGHVYVFMGSVDALPGTADISFDNPEDRSDGQFGYAADAAGDVNGDGYGDLIVGAPSRNFAGDGTPRVWLFLGADGGPSPEPSVSLMSFLDAQRSGTGSEVAGIGDSDGDGFADVATGAPKQANPTASEGVVRVYVGSPTGTRSMPSVVLDNPDGTLGGEFGSSLD